MAHIRQQLRDKVYNIIVQCPGLSVFTNRTHTIQYGELPSAVITTDSENLEITTPTGYDRDIQLTIRLYDRAFDGVDDSLDSLSADIENYMRNDLSITAHEKNLESVSIDINDGDQQIAVVTMIYSIRLFNVSDPEQLI